MLTSSADRKATEVGSLPPLFRDLTVPVIAAPKLLVTGPSLVAAAAEAGIVGVAPASSTRSPDEYDEWHEIISVRLQKYRRETSQRTGPVAANIGAPSKARTDTPRYVRDLEICRKRQISLVITVKGDPTEIVKYVHDWGGLVFHDVTTLRHAEKAVEAGVDGLILICGGGGGHSGVLSPFAFVPQVRKFFRGTIVLGGSISEGRSMRAAQALGADLCYMGTRFIATQESMAPDGYKAMIVNSKSHELAYTPVFTKGVSCNFMIRSIEENGFDPVRLQDILADDPRLSVRKPWRDLWSAGQGVGLIDDVPSVRELVSRLEREYRGSDNC
ncbi:nitronate monooxygenase [Bradyrhizobium sp. LHD-71]|uniref:NAD(P)H-dependent flavin oxidoreductase n=1 Tax=Bradyrhizobium sp. LHD-71 TaxID=3072141 RepID=UPI00280FC602|nr:nitronate monooxygenase [Bradyrhizobium sp. LHD-71]MDQ8729826.1 nitronate monooxygenase [Bradyrhizobium sp. LHD-71]